MNMFKGIYVKNWLLFKLKNGEVSSTNLVCFRHFHSINIYFYFLFKVVFYFKSYN